MIRVGIVSDTHGYIPPGVFSFFENCDEIWHAGDWGNIETYEKLRAFKPLRTVYGNIDGPELRQVMPEVLIFEVEKLKVCMLHIGGYPGKYAPQFRDILKEQHVDVMVCGHSHILKVMRDEQNQLMHFNPGAAGNKGHHQVCSALRLKIEGDRMYELEVWELKRNK